MYIIYILLIYFIYYTHTHIIYSSKIGIHFWDDQDSPKKASFSWATFSTQFFNGAQKDNYKDLHGFNDQSDDHDLPSRRAKVAAGQVLVLKSYLLVFCFFAFSPICPSFLVRNLGISFQMHLKY